MQKKEQIDVLYINKHLTDKTIITLYLKNKLVNKNRLFTQLKKQEALKVYMVLFFEKSDVFTCLIKVESIKTKCAKS